jgi:predicted enzyme related to lactoylglutathione lyase
MEFYSQALNLHFEAEEHGDLKTHYGVDIGNVHFGIHPFENLAMTEPGNSSISIAFNVDSLEQAHSRLYKSGGIQITAPHDEGFGTVASYQDPEGNYLKS